MDIALQKYFNMEGHLTVAGKILYVDAMKTDKVAALPIPLYNHVTSCNLCSHQILQLFNLSSNIDYSNLGKHPVLDQQKITSITLSESSLDVDNILNQLMKEAIQLPEFEKLITQTYRPSGNVKGAQFKIIAPNPDQLCSKEIKFEIHNPEQLPYSLTIRNHRGRLFREKLTANQTDYIVSLEPNDKFTSGLYYWKITPKGGKPIVGKVYVYQA